MQRNLLAGLDIGGTKCAVTIGSIIDSRIEILEKKQFPTPPSPEQAIKQLEDMLDHILQALNLSSINAIGISCGGPLNSKRGLILSPPNLSNWDKVDIITPFHEKYGVPVGLQNDANACALAEWKWGAGQGASNMIFLTFGTGMGAGLILNGNLYTGTNDMAGEVGHIRLAEEGPLGYGKFGSFEGFCSGGGIANLAKKMTEAAIHKGKTPSFCPSLEDKEKITAKSVGIAAQNGDPLAIEVYHEVGRKLGRGLAILVDLLNPERIIIGSIYGRQQNILEPIVKEELQKESLSISHSVCKVIPSGLGEHVGDFASLSVALHTIEK
ncbi:ROK family protein [uncultured Metabacillus sp.]|uniref:ROK family protein n=1 Tax=uncultured Metabacillus sp. TaxID=2860135 RepID=UPI00262B950A|nr:ROK family protein [uncultured Metabacillus sp.]